MRLYCISICLFIYEINNSILPIIEKKNIKQNTILKCKILFVTKEVEQQIET